MGFYVITEIFASKLNGAYTTTNNHVKDHDEAINMFLMRSMMLMNAANCSKIIEQNFDAEECYGFTKVELDSGCTIEISLIKLSLV